MSMLCTLMRRILSRCVCESQSKLRQSYLGHRFWSFPLSCGEEVALETFRSNREPLRSSLKSPDVCLTAIQEPGVSPLVSVQHSRHWAERSCCVLSYGKTGKTCRGKKKEEYLRFKSCHQEPTELFYLTYSMFCLLFPALFLKKNDRHQWQHEFVTYTRQAAPFPTPNEETDFTWLICFQQIRWAGFYTEFHAGFFHLILFQFFSDCRVFIFITEHFGLNCS